MESGVDLHMSRWCVWVGVVRLEVFLSARTLEALLSCWKGMLLDELEVLGFLVLEAVGREFF